MPVSGEILVPRAPATSASPLIGGVFYFFSHFSMSGLSAPELVPLEQAHLPTIVRGLLLVPDIRDYITDRVRLLLLPRQNFRLRCDAEMYLRKPFSTEELPSLEKIDVEEKCALLQSLLNDQGTCRDELADLLLASGSARTVWQGTVEMRQNTRNVRELVTSIFGTYTDFDDKTRSESCHRIQGDILTYWNSVLDQEVPKGEHSYRVLRLSPHDMPHVAKVLRGHAVQPAGLAELASFTQKVIWQNRDERLAIERPDALWARRWIVAPGDLVNDQVCSSSLNVNAYSRPSMCGQSLYFGKALCTLPIEDLLREYVLVRQ